ncbi:threonine ammonia-lyase, biosynthetic [Candidatus Portiera aleyrodidarum]|uniref:L-threonine dehydratase n=1 Tax=Candidatus Portiera aleyrodidarum TaxID=91844 RepID=A0A8D9JQ92_9GAMM|nr:threonine ammonia-lyase, biosynthetic [Candidatus Portiera aleyrodidarum]CEI58848.1 L-threonine dehydratase biosynthetic IlvA [Candidatus Portiera aleyrodidarum]
MKKIKSNPSLELYVKKILNSKVYELAKFTPLSFTPLLSKILKNKIFIKREDLQQIFSFKIRGAYNCMIKLSKNKIKKGVITASAGNHAQGVALSAKKLGIKSIIVMPKITPEIKVLSVQAIGSEVLIKGNNFNSSLKYALNLVNKYGYTYIPPFDNTEVIAGQGTLAMELLKQYKNKIYAIFVPVGGGGLIAGITAYIKYLRPKIKIIGVEPEDSACLKEAIKFGYPITLNTLDMFAEGVAVSRIGNKPFKLIKNIIDEIITVNIDEMCSAIKDMFENTRALAEVSGALSLAGLKKYIIKKKIINKTLICINTGANINFEKLQYIANRTALGENKELILAIKIPESIGSLKNLCNIIGKNKMFTELNYRYFNKSKANILIGLKIIPGIEDKKNIIKNIRNANFLVKDMSYNELIKLHIRYFIGGNFKSYTKKNNYKEELYCFEFPEKPGALIKFLNSLPEIFNISLFHYRNYGYAYGRVLIAIQLYKNKIKKLEKNLDKIGYRYWKESKNIAYKLFLK